MPLDGIQIAQTVRSSGVNKQTPIVMITGDRDPTVLTRAFHAGANFFLFKPVDQQRLLRVVRASEGLIQREKRRFQRVPVSRPISMASQEGKLQGMSLDISMGGLFAKTATALPKGTRVEVSLQVASGAAPLRLRGQVVRVIGPDCMGIEFQGLGMAEIEHLQEFLLPLILLRESGTAPARLSSI